MSGEDNIKQLMTSSRCDVCGQFYEEDYIRILGHDSKTWIIQVFCRACHSQILLAALIDKEDCIDTSKIEPITDLRASEMGKFKDLRITARDVLEMREFLSGFNGNFSQLWEPE